MYTASDLRKGLKVELDGVPFVITEFSFVKPGKGAAIYNCRLKNMRDGSTLVKAFRSNDTLQKPDLEEKTMRFSYQQGEEYVFIDDNYEHVTLSAAALGDARFFLAEDIQVRVLFHNGQPVEVTPPTFVEKEILETDPGFRGNTATNVLKPAKINGGFELQVPLFVNPGDIVRIDTRTGEYVDRVMKK